jgi:hypothetical protein
MQPGTRRLGLVAGLGPQATALPSVCTACVTMQYNYGGQSVSQLETVLVGEGRHSTALLPTVAVTPPLCDVRCWAASGCSSCCSTNMLWCAALLPLLLHQCAVFDVSFVYTSDPHPRSGDSGVH